MNALLAWRVHGRSFPGASRAAEDEVELASHLLAHQGRAAHCTGEAVVAGVPVVVAQRNPLIFGVYVLAAAPADLCRAGQEYRLP